MKNQSEKLFSSYSRNAKETSSLIYSSSPKNNNKFSHDLMEGEIPDGWYRILKSLSWAWQGLDMIDCYEILAKITCSKNTRTDPKAFDTVIGFRPGNWCYEWMQKAMHYQKLAYTYAEEEKNDLARDAFYLASQFYSVASYPNLKEDELAIQAQTLAYKSYKSSFDHNKDIILKEIKIPFQGKDVHCFLHLPHTDHIHPVVVISAGIDTLQCELFKLFEESFADKGIAMLTVDIPGVGNSSHVKLDQDSSKLHQAIIHYLKSVPWVDHDKIALMGLRFGGNISTRLAFLEPKLVKAVVSVGSPVGNLFKTIDNFKKLPPMLLDCLASRMQELDSSTDTLYQSCVPFSLVRQGLLGRKKIETPLLSIGHENDILCNKDDLQIIAQSSRNGSTCIIENEPIFKAYVKSLNYSIEWLTRHLES